MRLTYTALATLAALLSCSDSVPTAGNPKAVLKHDVSLVARGTGGDDNGADGKRLLRNAHAQDESQDSQLFEERSVHVPEKGTVVVASAVAHVIPSEANPIAKKVVEANTHVKDGAGQEKYWLLTKLESFKKKLMEGRKIQAFMEKLNTLLGRKPTIKDAEKPTTTAGNTNTVKDEVKATANGGTHTTHDDKPPVTTIIHPEAGGQSKFASTRGAVAEKMKDATKKMQDKVAEWNKKLEQYKKKVKEGPKYKAFMEELKTFLGLKPTIKDAEKPTTTAGNTNTVKDEGKATANGGTHTTHDTIQR
uniref:RxLR effector protein n=1 Tax=Hyaloperonospora arabidopsidis TaxID=272952 RepID=F6MF07_HYAAB|nr:RXLR effector [Hyaloperonospora arabidopsidis]